MDSLYKPFESIDDSSIALYINDKFCHIEEKKRYELINRYFRTGYGTDELKKFFGRAFVYSTKFPFNFIKNHDLINIKLDEIIQELSGQSNIFIKSSQTSCSTCCQSLDKGNQIYYTAQLYSHGIKPTKCYIVGYECLICKTLHLPSYYISKIGFKTFYEESLSSRYFSITTESVFEVLLIRSLTSDILFKQSSFSAFTNSYNSLFDNVKQNKDDRTELVDKRICEIWFYYNLIQFRKDMYGKLSDFKGPTVENLDDVIREHHVHFHSFFTNKWMSHKCNHPKCCVALNIDGDHKINRLTCLHYDEVLLPEINSNYLTINYNSNIKYFQLIELSSLNCPKTPERKSYYCADHQGDNVNLPFKIKKETVFFEISSIRETETYNKKDHDNYGIFDCFVNTEGESMFLLCDVNKKNKILWFEESSLPRLKLDNFLQYWNPNEEILIEQEICRVKKDINPCVHKCRTKGVILAVFNCGVIGSYKELFGSESLAQVSRFYLDLIELAPKYLVYDDACHLKHFLENNSQLSEDRRAIFSNKLFVIDRLHYKNHTRKTCSTFRCDNYEELKETNSIPCEETNFWFGKYKYILKHMNFDRFMFYLFIICDHFNKEKLKLNSKKNLTKINK